MKVFARALSALTLLALTAAPTFAGGNPAPPHELIVTHAEQAATSTAASYLSENYRRVEAICLNTGATNAATIGDSSITATRGILLPANQTVPQVIPGISELYIFSTSGTDVSCVEIERQ